MQENISLMSIKDRVFHFEISGKDFNFSQEEKIWLILVTLSVFHFEISGKDINDLQP